MADTDIAAALAIVAGLNDDYGNARAQRTIADRAMRAGQFEIAATALRSAMKTNISNPEGFALAASLAQEVNPQLGDDLWAQSLRKALPPPNDDGFGFEPSVAMWAFYRARVDAGQSRVLIEREWSWRLPKAAQIKGDDDRREASFAVNRLAMAMAALDPARALEMRAQAMEQLYADKPAPANLALAATLLMSDAQRARWGVDARF